MKSFITRRPTHSLLGPREEYQTPNDVPVPLRHNIKYAHETGVPLQALATIYAMPLDWIKLFALDGSETKN